MRVNVLHHGRCFDGAASAAVFAAFMRRRCGTLAPRYIPKHHRRGDPFDDGEFTGADEVAVVDFRYTQRPALSWYFDHHRSAFQLPGDREHFAADQSGQKFHDDAAPSCTGLLARIAHERFEIDLSAHAELIRWAEIIDAAAFPSPADAVLYEAPAMRLAAWIQTAADREAIATFIEALLREPLAELAQADWIKAIVEPRLAAHREDIARIRERGQLDEAGVFRYDLVDDGPRVLSHFIPYYVAEGVRYTVGAYAHPDGDLRLAVGYNPWLPADGREHDLAALCESVGGGGHPYVAGAAFSSDQVEELRRSLAHIVAVLGGRAEGVA